MILGNCWVVTMDDAGTEHEHGWVAIDDGLVAAVGQLQLRDHRQGEERQ